MPDTTGTTFSDAFDWLDDGTSRLMQWCAEHWRVAIAAAAGVPVLVGVAIGFGIGLLF